jgi:CRISPR system Cascade subunit CasC
MTEHSSATYVDIHVLQTVPPSNLNRDDTGSPKQAIYGGTRRARVSSQAWKRATRQAFAGHVPAEQLATRTKRIATLLRDRLAERTGLDIDQSARIATAMLAPSEIKAGKKAGDTAYLLFFGRAQIEALIDALLSHVPDGVAALAELDEAGLGKALDKLPVHETLSTGHPIDVALFGRMVADIPSLNVDAATQVAHAISTHQVEIEFDYYTAVDDENLKEETGAGMIGTIEFNSATLYRFATVGLHQLQENLGGDVEATATALEVFIESFVRSMPTGHQNSFAHRTTPNLVSVVIRKDQPVNLVSAFETPVRNSATGFAAESTVRLAKELQRSQEMWGLKPVHIASTYDSTQGENKSVLNQALGDALSFGDVVTSSVEAARKHLSLGAKQ